MEKFQNVKISKWAEKDVYAQNSDFAGTAKTKRGIGHHEFARSQGIRRIYTSWRTPLSQVPPLPKEARRPTEGRPIGNFPHDIIIGFPADLSLNPH